MDNGDTYRRLIRDALTRGARLYQAHAPAGIEEILVFDDERGHFLWLENGWEAQGRVQRIIVYARLRGAQVWVEEDWTEDGIATTLMQAGVPVSSIVLAFHDPALRADPQPLLSETISAMP